MTQAAGPAADDDLRLLVGLIRAKRLAEARALAARLRREAPRDPRWTIGHARICELGQDWVGALEWWQTTAELAPRTAEVLLGLVRSLGSLGRLDEAETAAAAALERHPRNALLLMAGARVAEMRGDRKTALLRWRALLAVEPRSTTAAQGVIDARAALGQTGDPEIDDDPASFSPVLQAMAALEAAQGGRALEIVQAALKRTPDDVALRMLAMSLANQTGEHGRALELAEAVLAAPQSTALERLEAAAVLAMAGRFADAIRLVEPCIGDAKLGPHAEMELEALRELVRDGAAGSAAPGVFGRRGRDALLVPAPGSDRLLLVFTGLAARLSIPVMFFHQFIKTMRTNVLYLYDDRRLMFLGGVTSLAPTYAGTLDAIRGMADSLGARRILSLGNSGGGYAAIRYGTDLDAERILCISPPTTFHPEMLERDRRARTVAQRLLVEQPEMCVDLRPYLEGRPHRPPIRVFYAEHVAEDRLHALNLAGLDGVQIEAVPGATEHHLMPTLHKRGKLLPALRELLGEGPA